ncbi:MAG: c-type cytochrome [Nibricoccus sp.]
MKTHSSLVFTALAVGSCVAGLTLWAENHGTSNNHAPSHKELVERGRTIVHQTSLCIDCHSPRNEKGEFIETKHLTGAPLAFAPTMPMPWAAAAPGIAGLPSGYTKTDVVHFLETGQRPGGRPAPLPPMPAFRFSHDDAEAVAAYLESLPSQNQQ